MMPFVLKLWNEYYLHRLSSYMRLNCCIKYLSLITQNDVSKLWFLTTGWVLYVWSIKQYSHNQEWTSCSNQSAPKYICFLVVWVGKASATLQPVFARTAQCHCSTIYPGNTTRPKLHFCGLAISPASWRRCKVVCTCTRCSSMHAAT